MEFIQEQACLFACTNSYKLDNNKFEVDYQYKHKGQLKKAVEK